MPTIKNHKEMVPYEHYLGLYAQIDPEEAAARCGVRYDPAARRFRMRLLYVDYELTWPVFSIRSGDENGFALHNLPAQMLLMRYLLEGRKSLGTGAFLPYREMPWGEVYLKPFTGRCLTRAAFTFGTRLADFRAACEKMGATRVDHGDAGYQFDLIGNYKMQILVWEGDEEFPPNAQILYSDNFADGFTAEDRVVAADILIAAIKSNM